MALYIPKKGDLIVLTFDPQSGHEQKGRRPALVLSNTLFNRRTGLAMVCPITNTDRRIPFHIQLPTDLGLTGFVMVEQVKSVDFTARKVKFIGKAPADLLEQALGVLEACLY